MSMLLTHLLILQITINGASSPSNNVTITVGTIICAIIGLVFFYYKREVAKSDEIKKQLQDSQKRDVDTLMSNIKDIKVKMDEIHDYITESKEREKHRASHLSNVDKKIENAEKRLDKLENRLDILERKN